MIKIFNIMLIFCSTLLIISSCSTSEIKTSKIREKEIGGDVVHDTVFVEASGMYEECIELRPGLVFDYKFESSEPLKFNIHYHAEDRIHYPVLQEGIMKGEGMIDPSKHEYYIEDQEYYCLMWENFNDELVKVSFECVLREK